MDGHLQMGHYPEPIGPKRVYPRVLHTVRCQRSSALSVMLGDSCHRPVVLLLGFTIILLAYLRSRSARAYVVLPSTWCATNTVNSCELSICSDSINLVQFQNLLTALTAAAAG